MSFADRLVRFGAALLVAAPLVACAGDEDRPRAEMPEIPPEQIYSLALTQLDKGNWIPCAQAFDEVERQHPYSPWARRAQLMSAFSYYGAKSYTESIQSAQRFLSIHPGNRDAPYAYYLIALCYYEQIGDVTRDQKITNQAHDALSELIRRYPQSRYSADARLKLDLVNDHLAGKEMEVGRFYERRRQWIAASLRFRKVIDTYQTTTHTPEALQRLVESYLSLGLIEEARRAAAVLGTNYPGSIWYERAFALMREHGPADAIQANAAPVAAPAPAPVAAQIRPAAIVAAAPEQTVAPAKPAKKAKAKAERDETRKCGKGGLFHRRRCDTVEAPPTA
jgi:outer membrane protein assembly factor BamD